MPDFSFTLIVLAILAVLVGFTIGWILRANRNHKELDAINAGWREETEAQNGETNRLISQNAELRAEINASKAEQEEAISRASELASVLQEAYQSRDEARPKLKQAARNLQAAEKNRLQLVAEVADTKRKFHAVADALKKKDETIAALEKRLLGWQSRVQPLVASFRQKNSQVGLLENELLKLREVLNTFEHNNLDDQSGIEPIDSDALTAGREASNEPSANEQHSEPGPLSSQDELTRIKGIGPAVNSKLNDLGIFYFHQVASLSEDDIDRISSHLKGFRNLLQRYDWIKQARTLRDLD